MPCFVLTGKSTSLQIDPNGVWTTKDLFVPWGTVKIFKLISSPERTDWLVYSPGLQWGYVTSQADQFTAYAEEFAGTSETAEVTRDRYGRITVWKFADGRSMEYSAKESLLLIQEGPKDQNPRVQNKRWIESWSEDQGYQLTDEAERDLTPQERALVDSEENQFSWGEFTRQEPLPPRNYLGIAMTIIAVILGFLFAVWSDS